MYRAARDEWVGSADLTRSFRSGSGQLTPRNVESLIGTVLDCNGWPW